MLQAVNNQEKKIVEPDTSLSPLASTTTERRPGRLVGKVTEAFFESLSVDALDEWEAARQRRLCDEPTQHPQT